MKAIIITDKVYASLSKVKGNESFSKLLGELVGFSQKKEEVLMKRIAGILSEKEANIALRKVGEIRKNTKARSYRSAS